MCHCPANLNVVWCSYFHIKCFECIVLIFIFSIQCSYFIFIHMQCFVKSVGRVTKTKRHLFWTDMPHMYYACEMWRSGIVPFWTASEWVTDRDICDEPRVRTRFRCHNLVVLCCTIVGRVIREQQGYAAGISFGLVACHKSMLCRPLLGGFRTYPFL
jgi:hypothetical protein